MALIQHGLANTRKFIFVPEASRQQRAKVQRVLGTHAPDGRPYETCPMCSQVASLRTVVMAEGSVYDTRWKCENCGYEDSDKFGALN